MTTELECAFKLIRTEFRYAFIFVYTFEICCVYSS